MGVWVCEVGTFFFCACKRGRRVKVVPISTCPMACRIPVTFQVMGEPLINLLVVSKDLVQNLRSALLTNVSPKKPTFCIWSPYIEFCWSGSILGKRGLRLYRGTEWCWVDDVGGFRDGVSSPNTSENSEWKFVNSNASWGASASCSVVEVSPITFPAESNSFSVTERCTSLVPWDVLLNETLGLVRICDGDMIKVGVVLGRAAASRTDKMLWSNSGILSLKKQCSADTYPDSICEAHG